MEIDHLLEERRTAPCQPIQCHVSHLRQAWEPRRVASFTLRRNIPIAHYTVTRRTSHPMWGIVLSPEIYFLFPCSRAGRLDPANLSKYDVKFVELILHRLKPHSCFVSLLSAYGVSTPPTQGSVPWSRFRHTVNQHSEHFSCFRRTLFVEIPIGDKTKLHKLERSAADVL